ncbi:MAG: cold-shock protein [Stackebrandtia sp.]
MQGTVAEFDSETRAGSVLLDDGTRVPFPRDAFDASELRLLRVGQRVELETGADDTVTRLRLPTM